MKCKYVYTLISNGEDNYTEQMAVSVFSLKYYNSPADVILVTDQCTIDEIHSHQLDGLLQEIDEIVIVETNASFNGLQRSRQLKTSIRNLVEGDFLFIDTDTIITGKLENINEFDNIVIGAVYDGHHKNVMIKFNEKANAVMDKIGWKKELLTEYYNSGIIFVKDCDEARDFYKKWNENWIMTKDLGYNFDQLSFAFTNKEFNNLIKPLPFYLNAQVNTTSLLLISNALILHLFYGSNKSKNIVNILSKFSDDLYLRVKKQKRLSDLDKIEILRWKNLLYPEIEKQSTLERKILFIMFKACMQGNLKDTLKAYYIKLKRKFYQKK